MTEFTPGRYADDDWRLMRFDGTETEVATWTEKPTLRECANALMGPLDIDRQPDGRHAAIGRQLGLVARDL